jgi:hypothetical protein
MQLEDRQLASAERLNRLRRPFGSTLREEVTLPQGRGMLLEELVPGSFSRFGPG